MSQIEIIGIHSVEAPEPVHLIELWVRGAHGIFDMGGFTQEIPDQPRDNWQVPFMEQILSTSGDEILANDFEASEKPELWTGDMRLVFFLHDLDLTQLLKTPFGDVRLPRESQLPKRLSMIQYEQP